MNPYYTKEIAAECMEKIFLPTIAAMNAEGRTFKAVSYTHLDVYKRQVKMLILSEKSALLQLPIKYLLNNFFIRYSLQFL